MDRNRIRHLLDDVTPATGRRTSAHDAGRAHTSSFTSYPTSLLSALGDLERARMAHVYQQAFLAAEAQLRRSVVERLLASI